VSKEDIQAAAQQIADALGETEKKPITQIAAIIDKAGLDFAQAMLRETEAVEAQGGMMLPDQSRRRTRGGVFFYVARKTMPRELSRAIFSTFANAKDKKRKATVAAKPLPPLDWATRAQVIQPLLEKQGELTTVKVMLIGRPGQIDSSHKDVVITTMSHMARSASLPKGVPQPPETPTLYTVYISSKQWQKVQDTINDPDDALIIEGTCAYDAEVGGIAVYVLSISSKTLDAKKRQAQKAGGGAKDSGDGEANATPPFAKPPHVAPKQKPKREFDTAPTPVAATIPNLPNAPGDALQKLTELYASASLFRQKIVTIQSKPPGQQFGLEMTQKLLKNVEDEITAIEKKYQG